MNPIAACAEAALRAHPRPALRLSELLELVAPRVDRGLRIDRLRTILEDHPDRFRVLEPFPCPPTGPARAHPVESRWPEVESEAWAVAIGEPGDAPDVHRMALKLRESVRWLTRAVDPRSRVQVRRWYVIVLSERVASATPVDRAA